MEINFELHSFRVKFFVIIKLYEKYAAHKRVCDLFDC